MKKILLVTFSIFTALQASAISDKEFTLQDVESYMGGLKSFSASFDQVVPGEDFAKGKLYIKKPGKFLWQYRMPNPVKIVSNGGLVYFVDEETDQTTQVPNTGILFSLLSKENVSFNSKHLSLVNLKQTNKRINVNLLAKVDGNEVPVTLILKKVSDDKLNLMKIVSQNQLEQSIVVSLYNQNEEAVIDNDIFKIEIEDEF